MRDGALRSAARRGFGARLRGSGVLRDCDRGAGGGGKEICGGGAGVLRVDGRSADGGRAGGALVGDLSVDGGSVGSVLAEGWGAEVRGGGAGHGARPLGSGREGGGL